MYHDLWNAITLVSDVSVNVTADMNVRAGGIDARHVFVTFNYLKTWALIRHAMRHILIILSKTHNLISPGLITTPSLKPQASSIFFLKRIL